MQVRGAPLIGATAAYGMAWRCAEDACDAALEAAYSDAAATRPTAVNLRWALDEMRRLLRAAAAGGRGAAAYGAAGEIGEDDVAINRAIGEHGAAR